MSAARQCWCGSVSFQPFSADYGVCEACGTLVYLTEVQAEQLLVKDDETDFYGKNYWLERQQSEFGTGDIHARARNDLSERNLHWLRAFLKYCLPPAKVLELGCSHGSFVALLRQTGFDASGVEMSPWVVEYSRQTFDIPAQIGPLEDLPLAPASLDAIVLMDVLEHLPDPVATMAHCMTLLKPDGFLLVQTPQFKAQMQYGDLLERNDPFLTMLIPQEHIYLFSAESAGQLFRQLGAEHLAFEPAIFGHYDMFFVVSRVPRLTHDEKAVDDALLSRPGSRLVHAMLTLHERELSLRQHLHDAEADRAARAEQITVLTDMVHTSDADRAARGEQIVQLTEMVHAGTAQLEQRAGQIEAQAQQIKEQAQQIKEQARLIEELIADERGLLSHRIFRWIAKTMRWPEMEHMTVHVHDGEEIEPKTIAVDLTPILPGGENGGAKIFVLELLRHLARTHADVKFILLTRSESHAELAALDASNVQRIQVLNTTAQPVRQPLPARVAARLLPHLPGRIRTRLSRVGYRIYSALKRRGSSSMLRGLNVDLLFCPFTAPTYYEAGIPTVSTIYDLQYRTYPEFFAPQDVAYREQTFAEACRRATFLAAISDYSRDSAIAAGALNPAEIRTIYLRMGQRIAADGKQDKTVLKRLGLAPGQYVLYPANFWRHKNHEMLLTAFGIACRDPRFPSEIKLVCTGAPGERLAYLAQAAQAMGLADRVLFPGYLSNPELASLLANSLAMIFPSLYEGFGLPVIEAMAAGVPVACSNVTSLPEVAADAAVLFDPKVPDQIAQALVAVTTDTAVRERLIEGGRRRAALFSDLSRMAEEYWDMFKSALSIRRGENGLSGVHADGWAGRQINVQLAPEACRGELEMCVTVPGWIARPGLKIQAYRRGKAFGAPVKAAPGARVNFALSLDGVTDYYEIRFSSTFVPVLSGLGDDTRELSVQLERLSIKGVAAGDVVLFPLGEAA